MIDPAKSIRTIPWLAATILAAWIGLIGWFLLSPPEPPVSLPVTSPKATAPPQP